MVLMQLIVSVSGKKLLSRKTFFWETNFIRLARSEFSLRDSATFHRLRGNEFWRGLIYIARSRQIPSPNREFTSRQVLFSGRSVVQEGKPHPKIAMSVI